MGVLFLAILAVDDDNLPDGLAQLRNRRGDSSSCVEKDSHM